MAALLLDKVPPRPAPVAAPGLTTSVPVLDRLLGPFPAGQVTLLDSGSDFVYGLLAVLCVQEVLVADGTTVFLDGGNSVDPHAITAVARRAGLRRQDVLGRVHVARGFTCHQMAALVLDRLSRRVAETAAGLVVLSCLPALFLDEDVDRDEARHLFRRVVRTVREVTERHGTVTVVTNVGPATLHRRPALRRILYEGADRVVRFLQRADGVLVDLPAEGVRTPYRPVLPPQATLDDFLDPRPRIADLAVLPPPRAVREAEGLRLAW